MAGLLAAFGAIVWICGARFSRSIIALSAVALGTMIGMRLPAWRGWQIDGMGVAVGGAVVLGTVAFLFHRTCIGLLLGGGMLLWAGTATWLFLGKGATWDLQAVHWDGDLVQFLRLAWQALPPGLSRVFPAACFAGLAGGITMAVIFPKLSKVLTHSLTGVTLMAVMGAVLLQAKRPMWISALPGSILAQGIVLIGIVLLGVIMQWQITPPYRNAGSNATRKS
jgi:hypothetical protein